MNAFMTLMYHDLSDTHRGVYTVGWHEFAGQLRWLQSEGYVVEGFDGLAGRLCTGLWPERYLVLTFDDGYASHLQAAAALCRAGARATFFLTRSYAEGRPGFLTPPQIRELAGLSDVGSHSLSHPYLARLDRQSIGRELTESKSWLEDLAGREITAFSIPNGSSNATVLRLARAAGYSLIGNSAEWWSVPSRVARERVVRRIAVRSTFSPDAFAAIVRQDRWFLGARALRSLLLAPVKALLPAGVLTRLRATLHMR